MKKKLNATTTGLIVLIVSAALCLVLIQQLYRVDNKYTQNDAAAKEGRFDPDSGCFFKR